MRVAKVGIVGTGHISNIYCENLNTVYKNTTVVACADILPEAAKAKAEKWGIPCVLTPDELIAREDIEIVVVLTPPQSHYQLIKQALLAGKHVFTEKPLAMNTEDADELVAIAQERGLMLGSAPETNYGAGVSTGKKLIEDGAIGKVLYAEAHFRWPGDEGWHPNPAFLFQTGAGPMFDRGPYFVNALVDLLGGVSNVCMMASAGWKTRVVGSAARKGEIIQVEVPTHVQGSMRFDSGVLCALMLSWDLKCPKDSAIEIFGTEGSILIDEPIGFRGPVKICRDGEHYEEVELINDRVGNIRGYAVSSMATCIEEGRLDCLASGSRARHVVEIMEKCLESADKGVYCDINSRP